MRRFHVVAVAKHTKIGSTTPHRRQMIATFLWPNRKAIMTPNTMVNMSEAAIARTNTVISDEDKFAPDFSGLAVCRVESSDSADCNALGCAPLQCAPNRCQIPDTAKKISIGAKMHPRYR
jgi:hypothetical protein